MISRQKSVKDHNDFEKFLKREELKVADEYQDYPEFCCLIEDCFLQSSRMYEDITEYDYYPKLYYEQYQSSSRREFFGDIKMVVDYDSADFYDIAIGRYLDMNFLPGDRQNFVSNQKPKDVLSRYSQIREQEDEKYIDAFTELYLFRLMEQEFCADE